MNKENGHWQYFPSRLSFNQNIFWIASVALIYFVTARLSLSLVFGPEGISAIWPPSGIFLSAILLTRRSARPFLVATLLVTDLIAEMLTGTPFLVSAVYALELTGDAVLSSWLLLRFVGEPITFRKVRDVFWFLVLVIILSNGLLSLVAAAASTLVPGTSFWNSWKWWAVSTGIGNLLVTPFIISWASWVKTRLGRWNPKRVFEIVVLFLLLALVNFISFRYLTTSDLFSLFLPYLTFPFLVWAALRFEVRGVTAALVILAVFAVPFVAAGHVAFFHESPLGAVIVLQFYLVIMAVPSLFLAAIVTDHKQAEREAARVGREWQATFDATNDAIWILDQDQRVLRSNKTAEGFFHRPFGEMIGKHCWEIVHGTAQPIPECPILRVRKSLHRETMELQEAERWFEVNVDPILDAAGLYSGAVHIVSDITNRKQAEAKILKSEERFRAIFERSTVGKSLTAPDGKILQINQAFADILGYTIEEIQKINFAQITHPDDVAESRECIRILLADEQTVYRMEKRYIHKSGDIVWVDLSTTLLRDEQETPLYFITNIVDITERKRAEDNIKQQTDAMEAAVDGMAILNQEGEYVYLNKAHAKIYGYENNEELIGKSWRILYDSDLLQRFDQEIFPDFIRKGSWHGEALGMKKDGSKFPQELSLTALDGGGLICVVRDITDHKLQDAALQESETLFRKLFEDHSAVKMIIDPDTGNIIDANEAAAIFYGWSRDQLKQMKIQEINTLSPEEVKKEMEMARAQKKMHFEFRHRQADGSVRDVDVFSSKIKTNKKDLLHSIVYDITSRKNAEKQATDTLDSLRRAVNTTIQVMVSALEKRDPYTAGHQVRSANIARAIATEMELPQENIDGIRMAGSIHDIGKLSIPAEILSKPAKLSKLEFSLIMEHPRSGYEILKDVESSYPLAEIVYQHHERIDGSGYPRNLKGDEILIEARILAVADVVEAMASHRPYRPSLGIEAAMNEIEKNRGIFYDADVADVCLRLFREKGFQIEG